MHLERFAETNDYAIFLAQLNQHFPASSTDSTVRNYRLTFSKLLLSPSRVKLYLRERWLPNRIEALSGLRSAVMDVAGQFPEVLLDNYANGSAAFCSVALFKTTRSHVYFVSDWSVLIRGPGPGVVRPNWAISYSRSFVRIVSKATVLHLFTSSAIAMTKNNLAEQYRILGSLKEKTKRLNDTLEALGDQRSFMDTEAQRIAEYEEEFQCLVADRAFHLQQLQLIEYDMMLLNETIRHARQDRLKASTVIEQLHADYEQLLGEIREDRSVLYTDPNETTSDNEIEPDSGVGSQIRYIEVDLYALRFIRLHVYVVNGRRDEIHSEKKLLLRNENR
ncbi:unnamed protein product [Echinostoma caproni]|uniref:DUF4817 domain-containing protein n=1 Tax=Echinostoma caproni TaxID=27848 RepID=A0A183AR34_9TREM|nr:unnamed protein product [Echinostoma caproni]